jgi:Lipase (class 3)
MNYQYAISYGMFVQFVALNWDSNNATTSRNGRQVLTSKGDPVIPGSSYTVSQTIYAYDLATDLALKQGRPPGWVTIGIVAINDANPDDVVMAIRGTANAWEWIQDAKFLLIPFKRGSGLTEDGFTDMYNSFAAISGNTPKPFVDCVSPGIPTTATITIVGHSLGAAVATLLAYDFASNTKLNVLLYTLASPRVGDLSFSQVFNHIVPNAYRIYNRLDIVPKLPPPLMYFHVGDETELLPPTILKSTLACEHHLTSYFNMLGALCGNAAQYPIDQDCLQPAGLPMTQPSAN